MPLSVDSPLARPALLTRLRELSQLRGAPAANRGVYSTRFAGWDLREQADEITLRPISWDSRRPWEPRFTGIVQASGPGSRITGEVRQHSSARIFSVLIVMLAVLLPLLAAVVLVAGQSADERFSNAGRMAAIGSVIALAGLAMVRLSLRSAAGAIRAFLVVVANGKATQAPAAQ